jgi:thiol peroxidase
MTIEREAAVTLKGKPMTVIGPKLEAGDKAPNATLVANDGSTVSLDDYAGKLRLVSVVYSLDTGLCDLQTHRFNSEAANLGPDAVVLTISTDLPMAQKRWCGAAGIDRVITLSDHRLMSFGDAYGTHIEELRMEQRSIFVIDKAGIIRYAEYVPEVAQHPDYDRALAVAKALR